MKTNLPAPRARVVIANWKMNPVTVRDAGKLATSIARAMPKPAVEVVVVPPTIHLAAVRAALPKSYKLGAQDVHPADSGPHTGSISARMVYALGARFAIVGHSERRAEGETDRAVNEKVRALLTLGMTPIVCVGERERDSQARYYSFVESQVREALSGVKRTEVERVVIAYEPIWAISSGDGKGKSATPADAHEMKLFIQKVLVELYGRPTAMKVRILYGGSVNEENACELIERGEVDGFLVGGASLSAKSFASIVTSAKIA